MIKKKLKAFWFWVWQKLFFWIFKRSLWCVRFNCSRIEEILKENFKNKYKGKGDEYIKKLALVVSLRTIFESPPQGYEEFYENEKEVISSEIKELLINENIKEIHLQNLRLMAYAHSGYDFQKEKFGKYFEKAKAIYQDVKPLTGKEFGKIHRELLRMNKSKKIEEEIKNALKIEITFEKIKALLGLISVLFLCTGVFYNQLYLRYFGIEVSKFFTLNDYLSTSIDKIYFTLISIVFSFAIGFYISPPSWRETAERKGCKFALLLDNLLYYSFVPLLTLITIVAFYHNDPQRYWPLSLLIMAVILYFYGKVALKYFKNPRQIYFYIMAITIFVLSIWSRTMEERETIIKGDLSKLKKYTTTFDKNLHLDEQSLILLASNSNFYFFYDKKNKKTYIIPVKHVIFIETKIK